MSITNWSLRAKEADLCVRNFINGEFVDCHGDQLITKYSPRDGSVLYEYAVGSSDDVDEAVSSAKHAFDDGRWQGKTVHERKAILQTLWNLIDKSREELALLECLDVGKPITYALHADVPQALSFLQSAIDNAGKLQSACGQDGSWFAYQQRKPVGVVGAIMGWNFPLSGAVLKMGPALVMGNSLVIKPSEFSSLSTSRLAALAVEAGVPPGVFNVVHGAGITVGAALAQHSEINLLNFTGSTATGKQMMIAAGKSNMKRLMLECGGKSPYIVFDDCPEDLDYIARDVVESITYNQG
jgi:acyl-CoA reductase-like NAD-dependent aldehyde dehydrogenase